MSEGGDSKNFLSRWSRRKLDTRQTEPKTRQKAADVPSSVPAVSAVGQAPVAPTELPPIESLRGIASEYEEYLKPGVDEVLKRAALKKLFQDPHFLFANMDKLDTYIDDYSIEDPIPEAMLRSLNQAKSLFLFEDEKKEGEKQEQTAAPVAQQPPQAILPQPADAAAETPTKEPLPEPVRIKPA